MQRDSDAYVRRIVNSQTRRIFTADFILFENGCFIIIHEENRRIGSISVSIRSSNNVNTAKVIPSKYDSIFLNTMAERVASVTNGICLVSLYGKKQLDLADMKAIMEEVMNIVGARGRQEFDKAGTR